MGNENFTSLCKRTVRDYYNNIASKHGEPLIADEDVFVVWSCKTLQNNKAMLSTKVHDQRYYELTYNGDKGELYVDAYKKEQNYALKVPESAR